MTDQNFYYTDKFDTPVSSLVDAAYYNVNDHALAVVLQGKHYFYRNVPVNTWERFASAYSRGAFYNVNIKNVYHSLDGFVQGSWNCNYINANTAVSVTQPSSFQHAAHNPAHVGYEVIAKVTVTKPVYAASIADAIAEFTARPEKYITVEPQGVKLIDS